MSEQNLVNQSPLNDEQQELLKQVVDSIPAYLANFDTMIKYGYATQEEKQKYQDSIARFNTYHDSLYKKTE